MDLKDLQDVVVSCPSFNLLNLVQGDGQVARGRLRKGFFSLQLCEKKKVTQRGVFWVLRWPFV